MDYIKIIAFTLFYFQFNFTIAQELLSLSKAIEIGLAQNYNIKLAENDIKTAENNSSRELLGYLPTLDLSVGPTANFGNTAINFSNGEVITTSNAISWTAGAVLSSNYTLLDKKRDATLSQLKEIINSFDLQHRQSLESTIRDIYIQYFQIVLLEQNISVLQEAIGVTQKRLERAQVRYEFSSGLKTDILNAELDLKRDSVNLMNTLVEIDALKRDLNYLLGRSDDINFATTLSLELRGVPDLETLISQSFEQNISVLLLKQGQVVNQMDLEIIDAERKPVLRANGAVNFNYQKNAPGSFFASTRNQGLDLGLTLSWNLLDGGMRKVQKENVYINIENQEIQLNDIRHKLKTDISNVYYAYQNALAITEVESQGVTTANANLERTEELFNRGQLTSVEFRQAQLSLINAQIGLNTALYNAKQLEYDLNFLSGNIIDSSFD